MKKILVTGATGFIGSYVLAEYLALGIEIAYIHREGSDCWRIKGYGGQKITGDLNDPETYQEAFLSFKPDTVIHMAWSGVKGNDRNNVGQAKNLGHLLGLLDACRKSGVKHFIGLGSQAEYGPCSGKINESQPTHPTTYYGMCKLSAYHMAQQFCSQACMQFSWVRIFSTYGPKDHPDWLIPYLIRELHQGNVPELTACEQRWDYLYVEDAAKAIVQIANSQQAEGLFNLGSGTAVSLKSIVEQVRDIVRPSAPLGFALKPYRSDQVMHLEADIRKLQSTTKWRPQVSLSVGLQNTVESALASLACTS